MNIFEYFRSYFRELYILEYIHCYIGHHGHHGNPLQSRRHQQNSGDRSLSINELGHQQQLQQQRGLQNQQWRQTSGGKPMAIEPLRQNKAVLDLIAAQSKQIVAQEASLGIITAGMEHNFQQLSDACAKSRKHNCTILCDLIGNLSAKVHELEQKARSLRCSAQGAPHG